MIKTRTEPGIRVNQGDIIRDVEYIERVYEYDGILEISKINFPFVVVLTQDCDLEQDHKFRTQSKETQDKWLISVLVAPLYNAEHVFSGNHLEEIGINSQLIKRNRTPGVTLKNNETPRYHYLEFPDTIPIVPSIIDFKHYFSVPILYFDNLKKKNFVCSVSELYREDLTQRFSAFLSRIGLPDIVNNK